MSFGLDGWDRRGIAPPVLRKVRVEFPAAVYHLLDRGDRREAIFRDEAAKFQHHDLPTFTD